MNNKEKLPMAGLRVLEFTHAIMGPAAGLVFADLGAELIRIEPSPQGDYTRRLKGFGTGFFTFFNRNKKSLALDLKTEQGQIIIHKLLKTADVLIENFGPGTMERLGLGYEDLKEENPQLIYCSLKGFMTGPYEKRPALDEVVQMMSGLAYMTGPPGQPLRAGASIIDIMGGTFGAIGVLLALMERQITGKGKLVKNGLFETAAFVMGQHMAYSATSQVEVAPMPSRIASWAIYRPFESSDEQLVFVGITSDKHWQRFCQVFGRNDLLDNEDIATNNQRIDAHDWLMPELERFFKSMSKAEIVAKCDEAEIPFAPIARPEDLFDDPQLNEGNSLLEVLLPDGRKTKLPKLPIYIEDNELGLRMEAPRIGEHTQDLLIELGYQKTDIQQLIADSVVVVDGDYM